MRKSFRLIIDSPPYSVPSGRGPGGEIERVLADAGGAGAPGEWSARLRELLRVELGRGARELRGARTGYPGSILVALAAGDGAVPAALLLPVGLRADPTRSAGAGDTLAAAVVEKLVEVTSPGPPASAADLRLRLGDPDGRFLAPQPDVTPL
jgi:hypothetical protein